MEALTCLHCKTQMDFTTFIRSATPWHLKCGHCQTKVRLKKYELEGFLFAITLGVIALTVLSRLGATSLTYAVVLTALVIGYLYLFFQAVKKFGVELELR